MNTGSGGRGFLKRQWKKLTISVVILLEVLAIALVATYAWVETVSSIKIINATDTTGTIDTYVFTEAMIGGQGGTIDLAKYFKQSGGMHLAPASSADGKTLYFPKANMTSGYNVYRKGNVSDKNTSYMSVTFKLKADTNADFFFTEVPTFSALGSDIRISVTSRTEGSAADPETNIYALSASTDAVVNATDGATGATTVNKLENHIKGNNKTRLFAVGTSETKIVTINVWLQKKPSANTDLSNNMSQAVTITNFGITSDLTPRRVTLLPTDEWDKSNVTEYFYAWCWGGGTNVADRLYSITKDPETEHYCFDYNGKYDHTLFIRSGSSNLTTESFSGSSNPNWTNGTIWNKTEDTMIPDDPIDPTYIIETISGSSTHDPSHDTASDSSNYTNAKLSTGSWNDPATVKLAFVNDQTTDWGTLTATSYVGTSTNSHVIESTHGTAHADTVHAWPGKELKLTAAAKTDYAFVGWYNNADGIDNNDDKRLLSASATFTIDAPSAPTEVTYYAKFKEVRTLTIHKYLDGVNSAVEAGTITLDGSQSAATVVNVSKTVDKGTSVSFSATANTGFTLSGIYTTADGSTIADSPVTLDENTDYYARFTTNKWDVTAAAAGSGGEVKAGAAAKGTTSTAEDIKYNSNVTLEATPYGNYEFVGWYDNSSCTGNALSTDASYSYKLQTDADVTVYAKFKEVHIYLTGYINGGDVSGTDNAFTYDTSTGKFKLSYKFTGDSVQYVTIYDGNKAYHPGSSNAGSGTPATQYNEHISGNDSNNPVPYFKWKVDACKGTTVNFTWDHSNKKLSWSIISRELYLDVTNWGYSDAKYSIWVNNDNDFTVMTKVSNTLYKATITNASSKIVFVRMNGTTSADSWGYKWHQTADLDLDATKDKFKITNYSYGSWSLS